VCVCVCGYLGVVGHEEGGGAVVLHEVLGEEAHPGVVSVEHHPLAGCFGLPHQVVLQQRRRVQVHHHVDEARDAAGGESLEREREGGGERGGGCCYQQ